MPLQLHEAVGFLSFLGFSPRPSSVNGILAWLLYGEGIMLQSLLVIRFDEDRPDRKNYPTEAVALP